MKIKIRSDSVTIEGYVNAVERVSKPLWSRVGQFIERICAGAFKKALNRAEDVHILLNHDWNRDLGSIRAGNLELEEDNIGLHARATITDPDVIEKARAGRLRGWSFGFRDRDVETGIEEGLPLRKVRDLDLAEVSILDDSKSPAYMGTLISTRAKDGKEELSFRGEDFIPEDIKIVNAAAEAELTKSFEAPDKRDSEQNTANREEKNESDEKSQEEKDGKDDKDMEKNANVNYNKVVSILNDIKEDL